MSNLTRIRAQRFCAPGGASTSLAVDSYARQFVDFMRILTYLLHSCTLDYENFDDTVKYHDEFVACISALSLHHPTAFRLLRCYYFRFNPYIDTFADQQFKHRLHFAWLKHGNIFCRDHAIDRLFEIVGRSLTVTDELLEYTFCHPDPDFLTLNRHSGWTTAMHDPSQFLKGGLALLRRQINDPDSYGFEMRF